MMKNIEYSSYVLANKLSEIKFIECSVLCSVFTIPLGTLKQGKALYSRKSQSS